MTIPGTRLIERDLPIARVSSHARDEKNLRSGHPWHLHIWWARRPWGACRAVALASLIPAPTAEDCPEDFVAEAATILNRIGMAPREVNRASVEKALLDFIGEFAEWKAGANAAWRDAARRLVRAANGSDAPFAFDPFSGYGAIPAEAARIGCTSVASDLNPVALLCLRTLLEAVPRHGEQLLKLYREGAVFVQKEAERRLSPYYPVGPSGMTPIAWLWARTVRCEGPGCGATVPLISQSVIANGKRKAWIEIEGDEATKEVHLAVKSGSKLPKNLKKTAGGGHAVCPVCGYTTNKEHVKKQGKAGKMKHRLYGVALARGSRQGKAYRDASAEDQAAYERAADAWEEIVRQHPGAEVTERYPYHDPRAFTAGLYGITTWGDLFSPRQSLALYTVGEILREYEEELRRRDLPDDLVRDTVTALALSVSNAVHYSTTMSTWLSEGMISCFIAGNAIAMRWDWAEANPLAKEYAGGLDFAFKKADEALEASLPLKGVEATVVAADAAHNPLPDDAAHLFFTDPPYYDVVPYADLADLNYVWLKRLVGRLHPDLLAADLTPKAEQIVVNPYAVEDGRGDQSPEAYQSRMTEAFREARRVLRPDGIGCVVFAHKGTDAWETLLASILDAGFAITASWPIDTERAARMRANKSAVLGSSVHLVVRPREDAEGRLITDTVGDWRDVLAALPGTIRQWMQRLVREGVVGADAIFACLGPALSLYSSYARVEKANGEQVFLSEYLEHVWSAISREALSTLFEGADASGFEPDARLTAMWLWTLHSDALGKNGSSANGDGEADMTSAQKGFGLEFDAVNSIAKGLGVRLEDWGTVVEVKGGNARLLGVSERVPFLFGKRKEEPSGRGRRRQEQAELFELPPKEELAPESTELPPPAKTTLDRVHQAMLLFGMERGEALKRFLVQEGAGRDTRFLRLAQALSALYPSNSAEKRWVDGVLSRKSALGL